MKTSYNWLQNYFTEKLPSPEKISEAITFHSFEIEEIFKVENDIVFDIKVLPDRAHDCLSHWGIAKEISAIFGLKVKEREFKKIQSKSTELKIEIQDEKCLRYMGRIVRNVKVGVSPDWLKERLESIGQKSINNLVDIANFVMFDLGQPIHVFDLDKLTSSKIFIRNAKNNEKLTTLDKKNIELDESILIIADGSTGSPQANEALAIAGIKGGTKAEVDNNTKNIVIEVANFNPTTTRKTAKKIGILTDAVKRYENEISPELCAKTMDEITSLIFDLAQGEVEEIIDIYPIKPVQNNVFVTLDYINKRLGTSFTKEEIENVFERLGFEYEEEDEGSTHTDRFKILVPLLRLDITGSHDLVEDIIKILGYEKIKGELPEIQLNTKINETFSKILWARNKLLNDGYSEVMTYVFRDKGEVEVLASASDKKFLRTNLTEGLEESLKLNQINAPLLEMSEIKIFEIGTVFLKGKEEMHVAFNDKKQIKEMTLEEFCKDMTSPLTPLLNNEKGMGKVVFKAWSMFPFISRDIAVWVKDEGDKEEIKQILKENSTELLIKEPYIFDSFTNPKDGRTSFAFRLVFQSYERTLLDAEINEIMTKISNKIKEKNGWQVR